MRAKKLKALTDLIVMTRRIADGKKIDEKKAEVAKMQLEIALESGDESQITECRNESIRQYVAGLDNSIRWYKEVQEFQKSVETDIQGAVDEAAKDLQG